MQNLEARFQLDWPGFTLDIDLSLPSRGITALFGPSGSGKTTLLRCIAGLERTPTGRLLVDGAIWQDEKHWMAPHRRPLGYVFQEASLFPHLSVMGNLRYGVRRAAAARPHRLTQAIELLGIGHLLDRKPARLSGGERQRVGIARALAMEPRILLLDEPLASLDARRKAEILPYLERLHEELDIPMLYVSHSIDEVIRLADYLVILEQGRALTHGAVADVLSQPDLAMRLDEEAGTVLSGTIGAFDPVWQLMRTDFPGGSLWTRDPGLPIGRAIRIRVLARDVSLARQHPGPLSIQNVLQGRLEALEDDAQPGMSLARIRVGQSLLLARLTQRASAALELAPGQEVWALVKSAALLA